ncbi:maleylpyruvate isomerase family mycothiol-dependent enzyme [Microbispora sp. H11081]|uniref:maleylpyruvate isomerase family mycothiol-dependent enzyme n=1 Tax=Microbispora sp. H11081 TaxID=2729107 RepID=UPI0014765CFA|nr:maleylpyruvate isomerase family mycothiol-dependent enzyme [Microbispora sp. H11081]
MSVIDEIERELTEATGRLLATAARLTDEDLRAPSLLPGWTRGHVLTHVARNADSYVNLLSWARTGVRTPQYASAEAREAGVEAGASRPAAEQLADLRDSAERFAAASGRMPAEAWTAMVSAMAPPEHPAWYVPIRRLREVEVHHADLGAGYGWADWPETYVRRELHDTMLWLGGESPVAEVVALDPGTGEVVRAWTGLGDGPAVEGTPRELLAWLAGRTDGAGLRVGPPAARGRGDAPAARPLPDPAVRPPSPPPWPKPSPAGLPARPPSSWPPAGNQSRQPREERT